MKKLYSLFLSFLLMACGDYETVRFESAQPDGVKELRVFNKRVRGEYVNCSNADDVLIISDNLVLNNRSFQLGIHRNDLELDSASLVDKTNNVELIKFFENEGYKAVIMDDSILLSQNFSDTLFHISESNVLKKFKGSYFMSHQLDDNFWHVNRLSIAKDTLFIGQISPSDTLLRYDFVLKSENINNSDSTKITEYKLKPSRKEFKKLLKPNSFEKTDCYIRKK